MTPPFQMPYADLAATQIGPRTFRKQVLKVGEIPYKGQRLKFDRPYLEEAVASFGRAFDQVPFVLADGDNKHSVEPERFRGEIKGLEMNGDGIDAIVELTEEGAEIVRKNPRLGVSVRLVPDVERNGETFPVAIEHVCGTLNPRVFGLRPWETDSIRSLSQSLEQEVIDLSNETYMGDKTSTLTDDHLEALKGLEGEARVAKARELLGESEVKVELAKDDSKFSLKKFLGVKDDGITDAELEAEVAKLNDETKTEDRKLVASLSDSDRQRIDLAESKAADADKRVAAAEWKTERREYAEAGVPPAMLDLAEPVLKSGAKVAIDLSDSEQADAGDVIRKLLDAAKGTVDLSGAQGSGADKDAHDEARDLASDEKWGASI